MIFILAGSYFEAQRCAEDYGLRRAQWRCFHDPRQLVNFEHKEFWISGTWNEEKHFRDLREWAANHGFSLEPRPFLPKKRRKRNKSKIA